MKNVRYIFLLFWVAMCVAAVVACEGSGGRKPVPRRVAYPRVELCDTVYRALLVSDVTLMVNADADVRTISADVAATEWIDVAYPRYGATLRLTVAQPADVASAMENRLQRIGLNAGDSRTSVIQVRDDRIEGIVVLSPDATVTPLQLLAAVGGRTVVSGAVEFTDTLYGGDAEARRPMVEALHHDILKLVESL